MPVESVIVCFGIIQYAKPLFLVGFPDCQPFMELFFRDIKALTELFDGMESGEVFPQDKEDELLHVGVKKRF